MKSLTQKVYEKIQMIKHNHELLSVAIVEEYDQDSNKPTLVELFGGNPPKAKLIGYRFVLTVDDIPVASILTQDEIRKMKPIKEMSENLVKIFDQVSLKDKRKNPKEFDQEHDVVSDLIDTKLSEIGL